MNEQIYRLILLYEAKIKLLEIDVQDNKKFNDSQIISADIAKKNSIITTYKIVIEDLKKIKF